MTEAELVRLCADGQSAQQYLANFLSLPLAKQEFAMHTLLTTALRAAAEVIPELPASAAALRDSQAALLLAGQVLGALIRGEQTGMPVTLEVP